MHYLLISDIQYRKAFDIISILKRSFPSERLILASTKGKMFSTSCYGGCFVEKLRTEEGWDSFSKDFETILKKYSSDEIIYVPIEEQTTDYVIEYIEKEGKKNIVALLPPTDLYKKFRNKNSLNDYCLEEGLSAPKKFKVSDLPNVDYPVLLKPEIGSGSHGIYRLYGPQDYSDEVRQAILKHEYLAQELLPHGKDVQGAFFLCHMGKVIGAYTHKRIRTSPEEGGVTVLSRIDDNPMLIRQGKELLEHAGWEGLIMLEYIYDERCDKYKLIEANPRLWGSIMLSEYCGANLLTNYVRICLGQPIINGEIKKNAYIRWLFPMDLLNWIKKKGKIKDFWNFKNTCFINWTYARKDRAIFYLLLSAFNIDNVKKLLKRT